MKTKELLVRRVVATSPDGFSTSETERIEVEVDWGGDKPPITSPGYVMFGSWTITGEVSR